MPIATRDIRAFEGPNLYYPQTAVKLQVWADRDMSREIGDTLKNWSQVTGMVIGYLRQYTDPVPDGFLITTTWTTPLPTVGAQIAEQVVADLDAAERRDEDYDHDDALMAIIGERKRQEPPMALLQLLAEAHAHDVPVLRRADGHLVVGTGARSWSFDPAGLSLGLGADVPWDSVGTVPLVAATGPDSTPVTQLIAALVQANGRRAGCANADGIMIAGEQVSGEPSDDWDGARRVLTDAQVDVAIVAVSLASIRERGLGFSECRVSVVTGVDNDDEQLAEAHGIVVLTTAPDGTVVLNADAPGVAALRDWTNTTPVLYHAAAAATPVGDAQHMRVDGTTLYLAGTPQATLALPPALPVPLPHLVPALAAAHALGIPLAMLQRWLDEQR